MRDDLLDLLACPSCRASVLSIDARDRTAAEIRSGTVTCGQCRFEMPIREGAVDALGVASETARKEIRGNTEMARGERATATDEWLLALPASYSQFYSFKDEAWQNEAVEVRTLIDLINPRPGSLVIDIGAGTTWSTNEMARRGCRAVAVDVSFDKYVGLWSSDVYMRHYKTHYERVAADMSARLPFRDALFDHAFVFGALHHAPDLAAAFREIGRVLKPGGTLGFVEATRGFFEKEEDFGAREIELWDVNEHKYPLRVYRRVAADAGLALRVAVAPSFLAKMDGFRKGTLRSPGPLYLKHHLGKIAARAVWGMPGVRATTHHVYPLICHVFGAQILGIARRLH
jgi:SAM-dependent methyltransferase/uncharacterized protein YbaR (Trm112 family)